MSSSRGVAPVLLRQYVLAPYSNSPADRIEVETKRWWLQRCTARTPVLACGPCEL